MQRGPPLTVLFWWLSHTEVVEDDAEWAPTGKNSFFRQLDHIVATMANEEFRLLYQLPPCESTIDAYAALKDALFARSRFALMHGGVASMTCAFCTTPHECNEVLHRS